jgi:hypothetical protein
MFRCEDLIENDFIRIGGMECKALDGSTRGYNGEKKVEYGRNCII